MAGVKLRSIMRRPSFKEAKGDPQNGIRRGWRHLLRRSGGCRLSRDDHGEVPGGGNLEDFFFFFFFAISSFHFIFSLHT